MRYRLRFYLPLLLAFIIARFAWAGEAEPVDLSPDAATENFRADISVYEWQNEPWTPLDNRQLLFGLTGNFRLNSQYNYNLRQDLAPGLSPSAFDGLARLSLEPKFVIAGPYTIRARFDFLGMVNYGSENGVQAPNWYSRDPFMVKVRRLWMELGIFHQKAMLLFGRAPRHLGLGIWANNGNSPDARYGDGIDQIQLILKLGSILLMPSVEFLDSGFSDNYYGGRPLDVDNIDDAIGITLSLALIDSAEDLAALIKRNEFVWNLSFSLFYRQQARLFVSDTPSAEGLERTDGRLVGADFWLGLYYQYLSVEFEGIFYWHRFNMPEYGQLSGVPFALALESSWWPSFAFRRLGFMLKTGIASGDRTPGFVQNDNYLPSATAAGHLDSFAFHPDYHVDEIFFQRILGTVSKAFYLKPEIAWLIHPQLLAQFSVIYSGALYRETVPGGKSPLGVEFDTRLAWHSKNMRGVTGLTTHERFYEEELPETTKNRNFGGFEVALVYAAFVPLDGLDGFLDKNIHLLDLRLLITF